jgi:hypothetical protein
MANLDNPRGFWPIRHLAGGEIRTNSHVLTTSTAVYCGDLVKVVAGGTVEPAAATVGVIVIGVSAEYVAAADAAAGRKIQVYDDPNIVFGVQADTGTAVAATDVFASADHVATAGSATTGQSAMELDSSDLATTAQAQLKVLGLVDSPDNAWGEHADLEVVLNEHYLKSYAVGV